jgi:hypothetical protein
VNSGREEEAVLLAMGVAEQIIITITADNELLSLL